MMVKTHLSISHDPALKGAPKGWVLPIRDVLVYSGARFLAPVAGSVSLMPGTSSNPGFRRVDVDTHTGKDPLVVIFQDAWRPSAARIFLPSSEDKMNETAQQYTQRILGLTKDQQPLAVQRATARKLERLIKGVSTAKLRKRPAPEKWSVSEIVAHLADSELVGAFRMRLILGTPGTPIVPYDQDQWLISGHYHKRDPRKSVEQFRVLREGNLALLKSLKPEQWKHYGMHAERGRESIDKIVRMFAGHDINHLRQIEAILARKHPSGR